MRMEFPEKRLVSPVTPPLPIIAVTTIFCNWAVQDKIIGGGVADERDMLDRQNVVRVWLTETMLTASLTTLRNSQEWLDNLGYRFVSVSQSGFGRRRNRVRKLGGRQARWSRSICRDVKNQHLVFTQKRPGIEVIPAPESIKPRMVTESQEIVSLLVAAS